MHSSRRIPPWSRLIGHGGAAALAASLTLTSPAAGATDAGRGGLLVGVRLGAATRDLLSISDTRPLSRGEAVAEVEVGYHIGERWLVAVGSRFGGSWFDFKQAVSAANGNIKDQDLTLRGAFDRVVSRGPEVSTYVGMGAEYGQARSFTATRFFDDEGPRTYYLGGLLRAGATWSVHRRWQLQAEIAPSVFRAHSRHASLATDYHWLGRSLSVTLGIRAVVLRGRTD
jgi:hypothetical protein